MNSPTVHPMNPPLSNPPRATRGTPAGFRAVPPAAARSRGRRGSALSLGTDTAGSIRQPAGILRRGGAQTHLRAGLALRADRFWLIAGLPRPGGANVSDACRPDARCIAGADERDATAAAVPVPDYLAGLRKGVKGMRIGLSPDYFRITYPDPSHR